jgi:PKD repeat protein
MGNYVAVTPSVAENLISLVTYDNRVYALATDSGYSYHVLYRLNLAGDDWETVTTFPYYTLDSLIVSDGKLYIYPKWDDYYGNVYRLNDTLDGVVLVVNDPSRNVIYYMVEFNERLYASLGDLNTDSSYLSRLNSTGDAWETVYDTTAIGFIQSMAVHKGLLYIFMYNDITYVPGLWRLNSLGDSIEFRCDLSIGLIWGGYGDGEIISLSYNGTLYFVTYQSVAYINEGETSSILKFTDSNYDAINNIFIYRGYLHSSNTSLNRLTQESSYSADKLIFDTSVRKIAVLGDTLYMTREGSTALYRYTSITSVSLVANRTTTMVSLPVNFLNVTITDYPATYYWEFGDTESSTLENPTHAYSTANNFSITLTVTCGADVESYTRSGYITSYDYFHKYIYTIDDLQLIGSGPSWPSYGYYELTNDIDASATSGWNGGVGFLPIIQTFRGVLDGANFTISNLFMNNPSDAAIFYTVEGASFLNLTFVDINITSNNSASTLFIEGVSDAPQDISNCHISGTFNGSTVGPFANLAMHYVFSNCSSLPTIPEYDYRVAAGIVGFAGGCDFINCTSSFTCHTDNGVIGGLVIDAGRTSLRFSTISGCHCIINATGNYIGGLAQSMIGIITDSYTMGYIEPHQYGGGIAVGFYVLEDSENVYSHCDVIGDQNQTGGLYGIATAGNNAQYNFTNCYSTGDVRSYWRVGGLVGESDGINFINCYSTGNISLQLCGGLVGDLGGGSCINCFTLGDVRGNEWVGGLVGNYTGGPTCSISNCYSLGNITYGQVPGEYYPSFDIEGIGGFIGLLSGNESLIENCFCRGSVSQFPGSTPHTITNIGGFVGSSYGGDFLKCYSLGDVTGAGAIGGFIGVYSPSGHAATGTGTNQCFSTGDVLVITSYQNCYAGGFVGHCYNQNTYYFKILNCFSRGSVKSYSAGDINIGGLVGLFDDSYDYGITVENCYSIGYTIAPPTVANMGGLVGSHL